MSTQWAAVAILLVLIAAVANPQERQDDQRPADSKDASKTIPEPIVMKGIENFFQLSSQLYSGAQPEGPEGFRKSQAIGNQDDYQC